MKYLLQTRFASTSTVVCLFAASLLSLATAAPAMAQGTGILNGEYQGTSVTKYVANHKEVDQDATLVDSVEFPGKKDMRVTFDNRTFVEFQSVAVQPGHVYEMTLKAKWNNIESIETNPSLERAFELNLSTTNDLLRYDVLPFAGIDFLDEENNVVSSLPVIKLLYGKWQDYQMRFVTPDNATKARFKVSSGRNTGHLLISCPTLTASNQQGMALNFAPSRKDAAGLAFGVRMDGMARSKSANNLYLYTGSDARTSPIFPGKPGKYMIGFRGMNIGTPRAVTLGFLDDKGKQITTDTIQQPFTKTTAFTLPEGAVSVMIYMREIGIESILITPATN